MDTFASAEEVVKSTLKLLDEQMKVGGRRGYDAVICEMLHAHNCTELSACLVRGMYIEENARPQNGGIVLLSIGFGLAAVAA